MYLLYITCNNVLDRYIWCKHDFKREGCSRCSVVTNLKRAMMIFSKIYSKWIYYSLLQNLCIKPYNVTVAPPSIFLFLVFCMLAPLKLPASGHYETPSDSDHTLCLEVQFAWPLMLPNSDPGVIVFFSLSEHTLCVTANSQTSYWSWNIMTAPSSTYLPE